MNIQSFDELENLKASFEEIREKIYREILIFNHIKKRYVQSSNTNEKQKLRTLLLYHHTRITKLKYEMETQIKQQMNLFGKGLRWIKGEEPIDMGTLKL